MAALTVAACEESARHLTSEIADARRRHVASDMIDLAPFSSALFGYALGTAQVLAMEWFKARSSHRKHLRLIRAELRRVAGLDARFDWKGTPPIGHAVKFPMPPSVSPAYIDTITATEFFLTDEHDDDNTQEALLTLLDACATLQHYAREVPRLTQAANHAEGVQEAERCVNSAVKLAERYDRDRDRLAFILSDALRDIERRLVEARFWPQFRRLLKRRLPKGENPPILTEADPRLQGTKRALEVRDTR